MKMYKNDISKAVAMIQKIRIRPYDGAEMETGYRTMAYDGDGILYHVSVFESREEAEDDLRSMSFNMTHYCQM